MSIDLVSACYLFAEATYGREGNNKYDKMKVMESLRLKIVALVEMHGTSRANESIKVEMTLLINQLLDTIKQTKKDLNMSRWIHMPKDSEEYQYYRVQCGSSSSLTV